MTAGEFEYFSSKNMGPSNGSETQNGDVFETSFAGQTGFVVGITLHFRKPV
jgi:hypothetical protein